MNETVAADDWAARSADDGLPAGFVFLADVAPSILQDVRYAGSDNFLGRPVAGYDGAEIVLTREAAEALAAVEKDLASDGLGLLVYDGYRPQQAVDDFVTWAKDPADLKMQDVYYPRVPKDRLFADGYIAERSGHSRGSTVDLTLIRRTPGRYLDTAATIVDMGTPFDFFDPASHTASTAVPAAARANRARLRTAMARRGFRGIAEEWWHFTLDPEPFPDTFFDFPVPPRRVR